MPASNEPPPRTSSTARSRWRWKKGCRLALIVIAAPILGPTSFGAYQFALTLTALFAMVADVGVSTWTIRGLARDRGRSREIAAIGFRVRGLGVLPFLLAAAMAALLSGPGESRVLIVLLGVAAVANMFADYAGAIFRGLERLRDEAVLNTGRAVLVTAAALVGLVGLRASGGSAIGLAAGMAAGSLVSAAYGRWLILSRTDTLAGDRSQLGGSVAIRRALVESAPIWVATLLGLLYFKIDVLILRAIAGDAELGAYSAAYKVFEAAAILPTIVMAAGLPPLARAYRDPRGGVTGSGCWPPCCWRWAGWSPRWSTPRGGRSSGCCSGRTSSRRSRRCASWRRRSLSFT